VGRRLRVDAAATRRPSGAAPAPAPAPTSTAAAAARAATRAAAAAPRACLHLRGSRGGGQGRFPGNDGAGARANRRGRAFPTVAPSAGRKTAGEPTDSRSDGFTSTRYAPRPGRGLARDGGARLQRPRGAVRATAVGLRWARARSPRGRSSLAELQHGPPRVWRPGSDAHGAGPDPVRRRGLSGAPFREVGMPTAL